MPGSPARFNFLRDSDGSLFLESVDFGLLLLPREPTGTPLRGGLYEVLASTAEGVDALEVGGHIHALSIAAWGDDPVMAPRKRAKIMPRGAVAETVSDGEELGQTGDEGSNEEDPYNIEDEATLGKNEEGEEHVGGVEEKEFDERVGEESEGVLLQRRAAMLALGAICATPLGYAAVLRVSPEFTLRCDAAARGLELKRARPPEPALRARCAWDDVALRGTAQRVLALLARHARGASDVTVLGWLPPSPPPREGDGTAASALPPPALLALPQLPPTAYTLRPPRKEECYSDSAVDDRSTPSSLLASDRLPRQEVAWLSILTRVTELSSRITQRDARGALLRMKAATPELFASPGLYAHVHALLSRYTLNLALRRFIHALFDRVSFSDAAWADLAPEHGEGTAAGI